MNNLFFWVVSLLMIAAYFFFVLYQFRKLKNEINARVKKKENSVALSFQRERLENVAIAANSNLVGSYVRFGDLNHLLLGNKYSDIHISKNVVDFSFFQKLGISLESLNVKERYITCLMPFNKQYLKTYDKIKMVCDDNRCSCHRSDERFIPDNILNYTMELILQSEVIIALLDGRNANVYYEVGIAHSIGKTVILLSCMNKFKDTPFDIKNNRMILYKDLDDLQKQLDKTLKNIYNVNG